MNQIWSRCSTNTIIFLMRKELKEMDLDSTRSRDTLMDTEELFTSRPTIIILDKRNALYSECMKEDSSKVSQMVTAEFSNSQLKVDVNSDSLRKESHQANTRGSISEVTALKVASRRETTWSSHVKLTLIKPDWLRLQTIILEESQTIDATIRNTKEETLFMTNQLITMLQLIDKTHMVMTSIEDTLSTQTNQLLSHFTIEPSSREMQTISTEANRIMKEELWLVLKENPSWTTTESLLKRNGEPLETEGQSTEETLWIEEKLWTEEIPLWEETLCTITPPTTWKITSTTTSTTKTSEWT